LRNPVPLLQWYEIKLLYEGKKYTLSSLKLLAVLNTKVYVMLGPTVSALSMTRQNLDKMQSSLAWLQYTPSPELLNPV